MGVTRNIEGAVVMEAAQTLKTDVLTVLQWMRVLVDALEAQHAAGVAAVSWAALEAALGETLLGHNQRLRLLLALKDAGIVRWHDGQEGRGCGWQVVGERKG